ncbi:hypothetical protein GCM10009582_18110 [Arthrobacter flavus]
MVGTGVDHEGGVGQLRGNIGAGAVGQCKEHHVMAGEVLHSGFFDQAVAERVEVWLKFAQTRSCAAVRGDRTDGHRWMGDEQAEQFTAGVAAGTRNRH